jgi:leucyl-tRNA synthetase
MEYTNYLSKVLDKGSVSTGLWGKAIESLLIMIAPSAPHMAEELWVSIGHPYSIHSQRWPKWDKKLAVDEEVILVVQINGKVRDKLVVSVSITEREAKELALAQERIKTYIEGKSIARTIYVPGKLLNMVLK